MHTYGEKDIHTYIHTIHLTAIEELFEAHQIWVRYWMCFRLCEYVGTYVCRGSKRKMMRLCRWDDQSINQSINQSIHSSINQSISSPASLLTSISGKALITWNMDRKNSVSVHPLKMSTKASIDKVPSLLFLLLNVYEASNRIEWWCMYLRHNDDDGDDDEERRKT